MSTVEKRLSPAVERYLATLPDALADAVRADLARAPKLSDEQVNRLRDIFANAR